MRMSISKVLGLSLSLLYAGGLTACGGSGGGSGNDLNVGHGVITLTSINPSPFQGCGPHPFQLFGTNFETVVGTTAKITFRAISPVGIQPFGGSDHATTTGTVISDTEIDGLTPEVLICGVPSITAEVEVMLESGVFATSSGVFTVVFNAPTITAINPNPIPAALPTPFTLTGTGFGPVGGPVTVRFTADNGALLFKDGTKPFADVFGTVVDEFTITGVTPIATVCGPTSTGASIQLFFPEGCCTLPTADGFVTFIAPAILSTSQNPVPAALQNTAFTITGTNFGPAGTIANVRFIADNQFPLFDDGTTQTIDIPGLVAGVGPAQTITLTSPLAAVCGIASRSAALRVISPYGSSCVQTAAGFQAFSAPTITGSQAPIPGAIATPIVITGTNLGPAGTAVTVRFIANGGATIFDDGTASTRDVPGVLINPSTVNVTTPLVTVCNVVSQLATVRVFSPTGGACADSPANYLTFLPPTLASIVPASSPAIPVAPNTTFTLNGTGYGPIGSAAQVTFLADGGANIFGNASHSSITVPALVTGPGTVTGIIPTATICGVASVGAAARLELQNGSCATSAATFFTWTAPTITNVNGVTPVVVPSSNPVAVVINGTGFAPLGGVAQVIFVSDAAGPPLFGDGTLRESSAQTGIINATGTQISVIPPHATVSPAVATRNASFRVMLNNGSCATSVAGAILYTAPTVTAFTPTGGTLFSAVPTAVTITGTNLGPNGSEAAIRFTANGTATPFGNGTANVIEVPGIIGGGGTTVTATAPLAALCPLTTLAGTARIILQDGSQTSNTIAFTYVAPAITSFLPTTFGPTAVIYTITGTGFGPPSSLVQVTFLAQGNATPFGDGTLNEVTVTGTVNALGTQVTGLTPIVSACSTTGVPVTVTIDVIAKFQGGSCARANAAATLTSPTIAASGGFLPTTVPATQQTAFTITGTGFTPLSGAATVIFSIPGAPPTSTPFANASASEIAVTGTINALGTAITGFTPLASTCTGNVLSDVRVRFDNGSCTQLVSGAVTFVAPTITSNNLSPSTIATLTPGSPNPFTITGTGFFPNGAQVLVRYTATNPIFADGTLSSIDLPGSVQPGGLTILTSLPIGRVCANTTAQVRVYFPNGACADSAPVFVTWAAPVINFKNQTNPAIIGNSISPGTVTYGGLNFPPVGTPVRLDFLASAGTPFVLGTSNMASVFTTVNAPNTIGPVNVPPAVGCSTFAASVTMQFGNPNAAGCTLADPLGTLAFTAPSITAASITSVSALAPGSLTLTTSLFPPNTPVVVRLTAASGTPFADGTQAQATVAGVSDATGTSIVGVPLPLATLCGAASVNATLAVTIGNANCSIPFATPITYNAPQVSAAPTGFAPQNLNYVGQTPFTITGPGGINQFAPVGATVNVRFSVAAGTPFRGGTSSFDVVPGTVVNATTITGSAPEVVAFADTIPSVSVRAEFEDGSCTNAVTTSYFRSTNRLAVVGTGGLYVFDNAGTAVTGSPFAVGGMNNLGGVAIDPALNRIFFVDNGAAVLRVLNLAAGTTAGTPAPALLATTVALGGVPLGVAVDPVTHRVLVANAAPAGQGSVNVIDGRNLQLIVTANSNVFVGVGPAGAILWDTTASRAILPAPPGSVIGGGGAFMAFDGVSLAFTGGTLLGPVGTANWTGGAALNAATGQLFLTFDDPNAANADQIQSISAQDLSTIKWTFALPAATDPTAALALAKASRLAYYAAGPGQIQTMIPDALALANGAAVAGTPGISQMFGSPASNRVFATSTANNLIQIIQGFPEALLFTSAGTVTGANALFSTSP